MKIDPAFSFSPPTATDKRSLKKNRGPVSSIFRVEAPEPCASRAPLSVDMTKTLLGFQESLSEEEYKRKKVEKGKKILDLLARIQSDLLKGEVCPDTLHLLQEMQHLDSQGISDPFLKSVLEEIEMRSLVILTQLDIALQKNRSL